MIGGPGFASVPFKLEYAEDVAAPSPNPLSYATPPVENKAPIPTPALAFVLEASNKENCQHCVTSPRLPIEEMTVDKAEDGPGAVEVHLT
jgi:hypothetical protein